MIFPAITAQAGGGFTSGQGSSSGFQCTNSADETFVGATYAQAYFWWTSYYAYDNYGNPAATLVQPFQGSS